MNEKTPLLSIQDLSVEFKTRDSVVQVLHGVSLDVFEGETLGIVGESGCGKSMTALGVMRLIPMPPGRYKDGRILLRGEDLLQAADQRIHDIRGNEISMIFQEPMTSLNPVYTVGNQIAETVRLHQNLGKREAHDRAVEMLQAVGIPAPERRVNEYPHQLSGGMRQRVMIAMALACNPSVLIADEPTTALDVTVQAQIFDLLGDIQERFNTAIILITHDMGAIAELADRVVVMYAGRRVEEGPVDELLQNPKHPYTKGLIECVPHLVAEPPEVRAVLPEIRGVVPPLRDLGKPGCPFAPRCDHVVAACRTEMPGAFPVGPDHQTACWLYSEGAS